MRRSDEAGDVEKKGGGGLFLLHKPFSDRHADHKEKEKEGFHHKFLEIEKARIRLSGRTRKLRGDRFEPFQPRRRRRRRLEPPRVLGKAVRSELDAHRQGSSLPTSGETKRFTRPQPSLLLRWRTVIEITSSTCPKLAFGVTLRSRIAVSGISSR